MALNNETKTGMNQDRQETRMTGGQYNVGPESRPMLGFGEAIEICFKKYFDLKGRARRSEYWWFVLFGFILRTLSRFLDNQLSAFVDYAPFSIVASVLFFFPMLSVAFRRLHDIGRSGWWVGAVCILIAASLAIETLLEGLCACQLTRGLSFSHSLSSASEVVAAVPMIIALIANFCILIFMLVDSDRGENKYAPSPKYQ